MRWPERRFDEMGNMVVDRLTNLCWRSSADLTGRPSTWEDALRAVKDLNRQEGETHSWRLPNINELETLVDCAHTVRRFLMDIFSETSEKVTGLQLLACSNLTGRGHSILPKVQSALVRKKECISQFGRYATSLRRKDEMIGDCYLIFK